MYKISSHTQNKLVSDSSLAGRKSVSLKWAGTYAVCFALLWCEIVLPLGKLGIDLLGVFLFPLLFFFPFSSSFLILVSLCFLSLSLLSGGVHSPSLPCPGQFIHGPGSFLFDITFFAGLGRGGGSFPYSSSSNLTPTSIFFRYQLLLRVEIAFFSCRRHY